MCKSIPTQAGVRDFTDSRLLNSCLIPNAKLALSP